MNKCIFLGNVGNEPNTITTEGGTIVTKFSLAVNENFKNAAGEKEVRTTWIDFVAFGKRAEVIERFVEKGSKLLIESKASVNNWKNEAGENRRSIEFVVDNFEFAGSGKSNNDQKEEKVQESTLSEKLNAEEDDDLPF